MKTAFLILIASLTAPAFNGDGFAEKFASLPEAVRNTAEAHMANAFGLSITSAQGAGGWDYQINTRLNGKSHDLVIDNAGKLLAVKDETDLASIPAAAKASIEKLAASSKILSLEKIDENGQVTYGAVMTDDAHPAPTRVRVAPDGAVKSKM